MNNHKNPKILQSAPALIGWCIYGWASDTFPALITTFIFSTYFIEHIAVDQITGTYQWANATAIAGIIIAITGPVLGAIADHKGCHKRWLIFFTFCCIISTGLLWFSYPTATSITPTLILFVIATISLEIALIFYNSFLPRLAPFGYIGRLSGWSWGLGYLGSIVALSIVLFISIFHKPDWLNPITLQQIRIVGPISALWFFIFSLPALFLIPDTPKIRLSLRQTLFYSALDLRHTLKMLIREKNILLFLIARMIYNDGLNTLFTFGGIFAAGTFHFTFTQLLFFGITLNVLAGLGAISLAWLDDYLGSKSTILISLGFLILFSFPLLLTHSVTLFWLIASLLCLFLGPAQSASRSLMAHLAPAYKSTELFGLFALTGRITAFIGPWMLGLVTIHFQSQRAGMATILVFFIVGWIMLKLNKGCDIKQKQTPLP